MQVLGPINGSTVLYDAVVVFGITSAEAGVTVNGVAAVLDEESRFQAEIPLVAGSNTIIVVASGQDGAQADSTLTVTSLALPPLPLFLVVTEPRSQSIVTQSPVRLSGRTSPDAIVSVNGVSVPVDDLGIFTTTVTLEEGPNIIEVVATDADGESLSAVVAVIFRPQTSG